MAVNSKIYQDLMREFSSENITLVAVSKTRPATDIQELYDLGHRDFGENYVQELAEKQPQLPADTRWHYIGHLQSNKVKYIAPYVHLVHGVDSLKLLKEINKQAEKNNRAINCLLQVHIAQEETKFGLNETELGEIMARLSSEPLTNARITGFMGMASFTDDINKVRTEFHYLKNLFDTHAELRIPGVELQILSMGMSADYKVAIEEGSTMVRIGSLIFGERAKP